MCQKASGGPFMAFAAVAASGFEVTHGALSRIPKLRHRRARLLRGLRLASDLSQRDQHRISVTIGSLDDPAAVAPTGQLAADAGALARRGA